ncbi:MAG TPA: rhomboid family intramembrane serine protease [Isosphaeraceae bacterium]
MRQIGTIADETDARTFADYLLTLGITTRLDHQEDGWVVWVHKEDLVPDAARELEAFRSDPRAPRYEGVGLAARQLRRQAEQDDRLHQKNSIDLRGRLSDRPRLARSPLTFALLLASLVVAVLTRLGGSIGVRIATASGQQRVIGMLLPVADRLTFTVYRSLDGHWQSAGLEPIRRGAVWRLVTPIFLHFGRIHLLFNMIMLVQLGSLVEWRWGTRRLAELVLATAIVSNLGQFLFPYVFTLGAGLPGIAPFGGMSGVLYGLFGYVWMKGRYDRGAGIVLHPNTVFSMVAWLFLCMTGALGTIANTAHVVGLVVGMLFGLIPYWWESLFG